MPMTPFEASQLVADLTDQDLIRVAQGQSPIPDIPTVFAMTEIERRRVFREKAQAAAQKRQAEEQAKMQGLPHPPQASILEQRVAEMQGIPGADPSAGQQVPPDQMAELQGGIAGGPPQGGPPPQGMPPGMAVAGGGLIPGYHFGGDVEEGHPNPAIDPKGHQAAHQPERWSLPMPDKFGEYEDFLSQQEAIKEGLRWREEDLPGEKYEEYSEEMGPYGQMDEILGQFEPTRSFEEWRDSPEARASFASPLFSRETWTGWNPKQRELRGIGSKAEFDFVQEYASKYGIEKARQLWQEHHADEEDVPTIGGVDDTQIVEDGGTTTTGPVGGQVGGDPSWGGFDPTAPIQQGGEQQQDTGQTIQELIEGVGGQFIDIHPAISEYTEFKTDAQAQRDFAKAPTPEIDAMRRWEAQQKLGNQEELGLMADVQNAIDQGRITEAKGILQELGQFTTGRTAGIEDLHGRREKLTGQQIGRLEEAGTRTMGQYEDLIDRRLATGQDQMAEYEAARRTPEQRERELSGLALLGIGAKMSGDPRDRDYTSVGETIVSTGTSQREEDLSLLQKIHGVEDAMQKDERTAIANKWGVEEGTIEDVQLLQTALLDDEQTSDQEIARLAEKLINSKELSSQKVHEIRSAIASRNTTQLRNLLTAELDVDSLNLKMAQERRTGDIAADRSYLSTMSAPLARFMDGAVSYGNARAQIKAQEMKSRLDYLNTVSDPANLPNMEDLVKDMQHMEYEVTNPETGEVTTKRPPVNEIKKIWYKIAERSLNHWLAQSANLGVTSGSLPVAPEEVRAMMDAGNMQGAVNATRQPG